MQTILAQHEFLYKKAYRELYQQAFEITESIKKQQDYILAANLIHQYEMSFATLVKITQKLSIIELAKLGDIMFTLYMSREE